MDLSKITFNVFFKFTMNGERKVTRLDIGQGQGK